VTADGVTPFHDLGQYMALPRAEALCLSPDGQRLVTVVRTLAPDRKTYLTALWEIDPGGAAAPRRLTWSAEGESSPAFLPDGTLLFVSDRPDPLAAGHADDEKPSRALWALPASGGEARRVATRPGGIAAPAVARDEGTIVFTAATLPGDLDADRERRKQRADAGITAILHDDYPIRAWDHELGPDEPRLLALGSERNRPGLGAGQEEQQPGRNRPGLGAGQEEQQPGQHARDLTPQPGQALAGQSATVTPDGSAVITGWWVPAAEAVRRSELAVIDSATARRRTLLARDGADFVSPAVSPDGRAVACVAQTHATMADPEDQALWLVPLDGTPPRELTPGLDLWPGNPVWSPDSTRIYFAADQRGRRPVFALDLPDGPARQLTHDDAGYTGLAVSPDGDVIYALRSGIDAPPAPVRIDSSTGAVDPLQSPGGSLPLPGRVTEVTAAAPDGAQIRGWLVLPDETAGPAPLLLWVHGGPHSSWNGWSWRWNPWLMAARGYAVLLPDPALSTGYGLEFIRRGHGSWGEATFADLMAITDAAVARDDIDERRTAMMGGSFGGYMANWIAGHTDRFSAIVTHASLWKLDVMLTSDESYYLTREFGEPGEPSSRWEANDPAPLAAKIRTPMLVIHGDKDYRVPIGNGLWLWRDLVRNEADAKFLYYPDENHWILKPGNATVWYETVLAFLARHVLGEQWRRPDAV
jgi:dipeptidyl aminopeptidase/acylaminoacyl peptidase